MMRPAPATFVCSPGGRVRGPGLDSAAARDLRLEALQRHIGQPDIARAGDVGRHALDAALRLDVAAAADGEPELALAELLQRDRARARDAHVAQGARRQLDLD